MCGHNRRDKIRNEDNRGKVGVTSVVDKMREEVEMVQAYEEEEHRCFSEEAREVGNDRLKER